MLGFGKKKKREQAPLELPLWFWGRDYLAPGESHIHEVNPQLAAGIAPGNRKCVAEKHDGNEDALGLMALEGGHLLLLADSHFGAMAAEQGLLLFEKAFAQTSGSMQERLFKSLLLLDDMIRAEKRAAAAPIHPGCATTLIAAWVREHEWVWSSLGDSFIWHIREGESQLENERTSNFLGDRRPLWEPFAEALEQLNLLRPGVDVHHPDFCWHISQLNHWVRGRNPDISSFEDLKPSLVPYFHEHIGLEALTKPWAPLHLAAKAVLPEWGRRRLKPADRLFLATDGIEVPVGNQSLDALLDLVSTSAGNPRRIVDAFLLACGGRRGGQDNLMCWLMDIT